MPTPTPTPEPTATPTPGPTATPETGTASQEWVDEFLEGLDANLVVEDAVAALEENPIFRAVRTQTLYDGDTEIFDAVFEYTGDSDAPFTAQGTHTTTSIGRIYEHDSTWHSTCLRAIAPRVRHWLYFEHDHWWKTGPNLEIFVPAIPFASLFVDGAEWEAIDVHRRSGPLELVLRTTLPDGVSYTVHIYPEEHPFRLVAEKTYLFDRLFSDTNYLYDIEEAPAVHESKEDCLSRNTG